MICRHVLDGLPAEYSRPVERAAIQEHEREAQIVLNGRHRAAAAAREFVRARAVAHLLRLAGQRVARQTFRVAMDALRRNDETRIAHPERGEEALVEKFGKRSTRDRF